MEKDAEGRFCILRTNITFLGKGVEEHRKIGWMVRSSLDTKFHARERGGSRQRFDLAAIPP